MKVRRNGKPAIAGAGNWVEIWNVTDAGSRFILLVAILGLPWRMQAQALSNPDIRIISGFQTWNEFVKYFSGKPVILCFWGTGCKPCIQQFAEHHSFVDSICAALNLEKVYMAVDYLPSEDSLFKSLIFKYYLHGMHLGLHPKDPFRESVFNVFFPKQGNTRLIAIPKYVLICSNGQILDYDLPAPKKHQEFIHSLQPVY